MTVSLSGLASVVLNTLKPSLHIFKSRVAQRFLSAFFISALLPVLILMIISYIRVTGQLKDQAIEKLHQSVKIHSLSIYERLLIAERQLRISEILLNRADRTSTSLQAVNERNDQVFSGMIVYQNNRVVRLFGDEVDQSCLNAIQKAKTENVETYLFVHDKKKMA